LGIGLLPRFQALPYVETGQLVEVLPGWSRSPVPIYALFPSYRYLTPKVRAFIDIATQSANEL
jgi:LysR family transcriptional regulator for bpeEF and oprC